MKSKKKCILPLNVAFKRVKCTLYFTFLEKKVGEDYLFCTIFSQTFGDILIGQCIVYQVAGQILVVCSHIY